MGIAGNMANVLQSANDDVTGTFASTLAAATMTAAGDVVDLRHVWHGSDPGLSDPDGSNYDMGTAFRAQGAITVLGVRIYHSGVPGNVVTGRKAYVWSAIAGSFAVIGQATLPDNLTGIPLGWATYELDDPLDFVDEDCFLVVWSVDGNGGAAHADYVAISGAFGPGSSESTDGSGRHRSPDGLVDMPHWQEAPLGCAGNGVFAALDAGTGFGLTAPTGSFDSRFYGVDIEYEAT